MRRPLLTLLATILSTAAIAQTSEPNSTLAELRAKDQAARSGAIKDINWAVVSTEDAARRAQVLDLIRQGSVRTAEDYCNAALIFQHGITLDEIRMAFSLATTSRVLDPSSTRCNWLSAAAWDRLLMTLKKPQWYGTQFTRPQGGHWELYPVDETAVTDSERAQLGVPSLAEAKARAAKMNASKD